MRRTLIALILIGSALGFAGVLSGASAEERPTSSLDTLPAPVKETVLKETQGATEVKVAVVYEVEFVVDGKEMEIEVSADGKVLDREADAGDEEKEGEDKEGEDKEGDEKEVSLNDLPKAVQDAIAARAAASKINEIEVEDEDGKIVYTAEIVENGKEMDVTFDADGKILASEPAEKGENEGEEADKD